MSCSPYSAMNKHNKQVVLQGRFKQGILLMSANRINIEAINGTLLRLSYIHGKGQVVVPHKKTLKTEL